MSADPHDQTPQSALGGALTTLWRWLEAASTSGGELQDDRTMRLEREVVAIQARLAGAPSGPTPKEHPMSHSMTEFVGAALALSAAMAVVPGIASAQAAPGPGPSGGLLPPVPTIRVLAIGHLTPNATPDAMRATMPSEVADTVRLYLAGKIDSWYSRQDKPGVVFVLNVTEAEQAHEMLENLPLGVKGLMEFDLIPLGPLAPLGILAEPAPQEQDGKAQ